MARLPVNRCQVNFAGEGQCFAFDPFSNDVQEGAGSERFRSARYAGALQC